MAEVRPGGFFATLAAALGAVVAALAIMFIWRERAEPETVPIAKRYRRRDPGDDARAIAGDWQRVGDDLRAAGEGALELPALRRSGAQ